MSDEARMWTELGRLGDEPLEGERSDAELLEAALAGIEPPAATRPMPAVLQPADADRRRWTVVVAVGLAMAAAVLLGWWGLPRIGLLDDDADDPGSMAPAVVQPSDPSGGQAVARGGGARGRSARPGLAATDGLGETGCATSTDACPDADGVGTTGEPACATDCPEVDDDGSPTDEAECETSAEACEREEPAVGRGGSRSRSPRGRRASPKSAHGMLERAQQLVSSGDRAGAIAAYERLVERFAHTAEAKAARVSLGRLELGRGRARKALAHFDAYLASSAGTLVEEARYGRIRALRRLGRTQQELRSIEAFLADHAQSLYAARLRARAEELATP